MDTFKVTEKDFKFFVKEVLKWKSLFNLSEWTINIELDDIEDNANAMVNMVSRRVDITLNEIQELTKSKEYDLSNTAFHEVVEGCLLGGLISTRLTHDNIYDAEIHAVVNRLWNILKDNQNGNTKKK